MSISGAVTELNKEIERLTKIRDSLLQGAPAAITALPPSQPVMPQKRKYVRSIKTAAKSSITGKKSVVARKSAPAKTGASASKRVISPETRKKMSDAAKARAAAKSVAKK